MFQVMNHGSLFSGIGGFDLASKWMGWNNKFHCEWEDFPRKILEYYFPNAISYGDIKQTDFTIWRGRIDILTGGFPCQPYSAAGRRLGKEDERHLWPEMLRTIREIKPRWIVGENVRGLLNWNGGVVLDEIYTDLEDEGYKVWTFVLPAASVNAPHRRDRVWIVAYSSSLRHRGGNIRPKTNKVQGYEMGEGFGQHRNRIWGETEGRSTTTTNTNEYRWETFPTKSPICGEHDGIPRKLDSITFSKWRKESIKAYGNAIVPQVAHQIFRAIERYEQGQR